MASRSRKVLASHFLRHAELIQRAPIVPKDALLAEYRKAATVRFGTVTADRMTATMREWLGLPATGH